MSRIFGDAMALSPDNTLIAQFDETWRSDCEFLQKDSETHWRPVKQSPVIDFSGLANAVEQPIHPVIQEYYGSFWAGTVECESAEGQVSLIQLWNQEDFDRLVANLVGHFMAKQKLKQPFTVFFANAEPDSEFFLSIDNESGCVLLEEPGKPPVKEVERDLSTFLDRLTPVSHRAGIY